MTERETGAIVRRIFVYNADSGRLNLALDIAHKLLSPATYNCALCALTHGAFQEREQWRAFRESDTGEMLFLHRDEFRARYGYDADCPVVLDEAADASLSVALTPETLRGFNSVEELIEALQSRASAVAPGSD